MRRTTSQLAVLSMLTAGALAFGAGTAVAEEPVPEPDSFTSMFTAMATPGNVVNMNGMMTPGEPGSSGTFNFRINSDEEIICYDIVLNGVTPPYQSPAATATHIHQGPAGVSGPARVVFPDPTPQGDGTLTSSGCMQGPFTTGQTNQQTGQDNGAGFSLAQIEANPSGFYVDSHTRQFMTGAVRGQLTRVPMGGVETGAGATATGSAAPYALGAGALVAAAAVGTVAVRRSRARV